MKYVEVDYNDQLYECHDETIKEGDYVMIATDYGTKFCQVTNVI